MIEAKMEGEGAGDGTTEREEIYARYEKEQELQPAVTETETEKPGAEVVTTETTPEVVEDKEATSGEKKGEQDKKAEVPLEEPPKTEKQEKFVPLEALHSERDKRKREKELREAAEKRARELEELLRQTSVPSESVLSEDPIVRQMYERVMTLEQIIQEREKIERHRDVEKLQQQFRDNLAKTDRELAEEGYPGFSLAISAVTDELRTMVEENPENAAFDNPTGWKKIWKEKTFPKLSAAIVAANKSAVLASKVELKKQANLVSSPGAPQSKEKSEEPKTQEEERLAYIRDRQARGY